jgi:ABC-2 type transport system permease protein
MAHALEAAAGAIYDIGYRNYEGARLGRGYAFRTLYVHSLRTAFGLGRGGRSLIVPWGLFAFICLPAIVQVAVTGLSRGAGNLVDYDDYMQPLSLLLALFCAAQAPELVSRDQHSRVLPLYFSRALRKHDYAVAKLLAMWTAVFILVLTPLVIILTGRLGLPADFGAAFKAESKNFLPILLTPVVFALAFATPSIALASLMARRGIASALVLGPFMLTLPISAILMQAVEGRWGAYGVLINPIFAAGGAVLALYGEKADGVLRQANLPPMAYVIGVALYGIVFSLLLINRYRRLSA